MALIIAGKSVIEALMGEKGQHTVAFSVPTLQTSYPDILQILITLFLNDTHSSPDIKSQL